MSWVIKADVPFSPMQQRLLDFIRLNPDDLHYALGALVNNMSDEKCQDVLGILGDLGEGKGVPEARIIGGARNKPDIISETVQRVLSETHTVIGIMEISKMMKEVRDAVAAGTPVEEAAQTIVPKYHSGGVS